MKPFRVALLLGIAALLFSRAIPSLLLMGQEPSPKKVGAVPSGGSNTSSDHEAVANQMHATQEGIKAYREEKFKAAAASFETAAASNANATQTAHAYAWLARSYLHLHLVPEAEEAARKATDADMELANAQTAMAEVYFREGKFPEAEKLLIPLVKNQNAMARTYLALAKIHRATANYKTARMLTEIAHKNDPKDPDIDQAWLFSMTRQERVEEWKKRLAEGRYEDGEEKLAAAIAVAADRNKNQNRSCTLVNKVSATEAKLEPRMLDARRFGSYELGVKVNGVKAMLELDTGAGGILVSTRIAEKAGLAKIADNAIGGIGDKGAANGYVAFAEKVQIGELEFHNCYQCCPKKVRAVDRNCLIERR